MQPGSCSIFHRFLQFWYSQGYLSNTWTARFCDPKGKPESVVGIRVRPIFDNKCDCDCLTRICRWVPNPNFNSQRAFVCQHGGAPLDKRACRAGGMWHDVGSDCASLTRLTTASCARAPLQRRCWTSLSGLGALRLLRAVFCSGSTLIWGKRGKVNSESRLPRNPIQFHVLSFSIHLQERTVKPRSPACVRVAEAKNNLIYGLNVSLVRYSLALKLFQYARKRRAADRVASKIRA